LGTPEQLGRYKIIREIGRGAMGVVYEALDEALQREVAVKALMFTDAEEQQQQIKRFRQEAKAAGGLAHPNIVAIYDMGADGEMLYIAMELLRGVELRHLIKNKELPLPLAVHVGAQVAAGMAAAHARGIVHRDIKPSNVMVLPGNHVKILDFGIARMQSSEIKTRTGVMLGSPKYMSPEQVEGRVADHRSDIFTMGTMLYEAVTGVSAFSGTDFGSLLFDVMRGIPPKPSERNPQIPHELDAIIERAMQKEPAKRYQDTAQMAEDLARVALTLGVAALPGVAVATAPMLPEDDTERTLPKGTPLGDALPQLDEMPDLDFTKSEMAPQPKAAAPAVTAPVAAVAAPVAEPIPSPVEMAAAPLPTAAPKPEFSGTSSMQKRRLEDIPPAPELSLEPIATPAPQPTPKPAAPGWDATVIMPKGTKP
jgi:serine/threonine protein kinase